MNKLNNSAEQSFNEFFSNNTPQSIQNQSPKVHSLHADATL